MLNKLMTGEIGVVDFYWYHTVQTIMIVQMPFNPISLDKKK